MKEKSAQRKPWRWFLALENWLHSLREFWVKIIGQRPAVIPYLGYGSVTQIRVLARAVYTGKNVRQNPSVRIRGWRSFLAVPFRHQSVEIRIADQVFTAETDEGGILDHAIDISLEPGWQKIILSLSNGYSQEGSILIIADSTKFGVISDIDDTVMVTSLTQPLLALWNTFLLETDARDAVPGMPILYERIRQGYPDSPFFYLSTGAWNALPTHQRFLARNMFPVGPMLLTDWGTTTERWFRSGKEHKRENLVHLVEQFPHIRWLLIGDDGEHDPERYQELASAYPERVLAIAIRKLTHDRVEWLSQEPDNTSNEISTSQQIVWLFGHDGSALAAQLKQLAVL